jgi:hypothetical protein
MYPARRGISGGIIEGTAPGEDAAGAAASAFAAPLRLLRTDVSGAQIDKVNAPHFPFYLGEKTS